MNEPALFRAPPQNLRAEQEVLGAMLLDPAKIHDVLAALRPEDFFRESHQTIFRTIRDLYGQGDPVTPIAIGEELLRRGELAAVGGDEALWELGEAAPHAESTIYNAAVVRQKAIARSLQVVAQTILREIGSNDFTGDELLGRAQASLMDLDAGRTDRRLVSIRDVLPEVMERVSRRRGGGDVTGISTGLTDLDFMLGGGLQAEQLVILAARPSMGKTALALNICDHVAVSLREPVLFVTLEMSESQLVERMVLARGRINGHKARSGYLDDHDWTNFRGVCEVLAHTEVHFDATPTQDMIQIISTARGMALRHNIGLVILDYIQLVDSDPSSRDSRQEQVSKISRRLKSLARELKVPVIALSQLNRAVESRDDRRPRMADLRESGAIEQDADMVLLLHRPEYYDPNDSPGIAELIVAKNRNGATGTVRLRFDKPSMRFELLSNEEIPRPAMDDSF